MSEIEIKMFPASYGDSFLVTCNGELKTHILIDMGFYSTYDNYIKEELVKLGKKGEKISLLVITHIDEDHILGGIRFLEDNCSNYSPKVIEIEEVWYNSYKHLLFNEDRIQGEDKKTPNDTKKFLEKIIAKGHGREQGVRKISDISCKQGSSFAGLLYKNGYSQRWNCSYNHDAILVKTKNDTLKTVSINNDVNITILSPEKSNLEKLRQEWEKKIKEWGFEDKLYSNELTDEAFEIYVANELDKMKKSRKVKNVSGEKKELDIELIAKNDIDSDNKVVNGSSIAFILEFRGKKVLFLGDAHSETIEINLEKILKTTNDEKLYFDAVKVSHHGSKFNMRNKLFNLFYSEKYFISTNGKIKNHPDIETICKIIASNRDIKKKIIFNYKPSFFETINDEIFKEKYNYELEYTNDTKGGIENQVTSIFL